MHEQRIRRYANADRTRFGVADRRNWPILVLAALALSIVSCNAKSNGDTKTGKTTATTDTNSAKSPTAIASHYIRRQPTNRDVIVFVHGVTGDATSTWTSDGGQYWPAMLTRDTVFNGWDVYVYQYPSPLFNVTYSISDVADNMRLQLDNDAIFSDHARVVFLSHSMGGLVTRAFLTRYKDFAPKVLFLYFYATPTEGSPYAILAAAVSHNPQYHDMYPMSSDSYLSELRQSFTAAHFHIPSYCAYERVPLAGQIIVDEGSATNLCTEPSDPIIANHMEIVKPESPRDVRYAAFADAMRIQLGVPALAIHIDSTAYRPADNSLRSKVTMTEQLSLHSEHDDHNQRFCTSAPEGWRLDSVRVVIDSSQGSSWHIDLAPGLPAANTRCFDARTEHHGLGVSDKVWWRFAQYLSGPPSP